MQSPQYSIRIARREDSSAIANHRAAMFMDMGRLNMHEAGDLKDDSEPWSHVALIDR